MPQSTDAILAYGYDLGPDAFEGDWKLKEVDALGELDVAWWRDSPEDFLSAAELRLGEVLPGHGIEVVDYCSDRSPAYVLAVKASVIRAHRGKVEVLNPLELAEQAATGEWDSQLTAALRALLITPTREKAAWLMCSWWCL